MALTRRDRLSPAPILSIPDKNKKKRTGAPQRVAVPAAGSASAAPAGAAPAPAPTPASTAPAGVPTAPVKVPSLADGVDAARRLNEILKPMAPASARTKPVRTAQERLDVAELEADRGLRLSQTDADRLNRFYVDRMFDRRDDWLASSTGRFEDTPAAKVTGTIISGSGLSGRRLELTRAFQAGLGDPTLARGSYARSQAEANARKQAHQERLDAEKERANAYWEFWKKQNAERRAARLAKKSGSGKTADQDVETTVNVDMKGGHAFGTFPVDADGYHRRGGAGPDKLALIARSFGY